MKGLVRRTTSGHAGSGAVPEIVPAAFDASRFLGSPPCRRKAAHGLVRECLVGYDGPAKRAFLAFQSVCFPWEHGMTRLRHLQSCPIPGATRQDDARLGRFSGADPAWRQGVALPWNCGIGFRATRPAENQAMSSNPTPDGCHAGIPLRRHLDDNGFTPARCPLIFRLTSIWRATHSSTSVSIQPTALAPSDTGLGNLPSVTRR